MFYRASYEYAGLYADRVGELLAQVYGEVVTPEKLPDGRMYWNIAQKVVQEPLVNNYRLAAVAAEKAQKAQNRRAGIGLNAVRPELNEERVKGIMNKVSEAADYDEAASMLDRPVVNMTRAVVDDSVKANAAFQSESGLDMKVVRRTTGAHPCDWCKSLAGTYDYEKVKGGHDVWRRHLDCHCVIEVVSSKGTERVNNYRPSGRRDEAALEARRSAPAVEMPTRAEIEARKAFTEEHERGVRDKKHSSGNVPGFGKYTQKDLKVNVDLVMSPAYRRNFDRITDDPAVNQALCDASRTMLMHRSGSDLEDMVLIDAKTGLIVGKQDRSITAH